MVQSRCGIVCDECEYKEQVGCKGCVSIHKPFWGEECKVKSCCEDKALEHCGLCGQFPCQTLNAFAFDKKQGDDGKRITQCKKWSSQL